MKRPVKFSDFSHPDFVILIGILILAAVLRWISIATESLWLDESYSWWDAQQSLHDLWTLVPQCDPHPPLYFFLLKGWLDLFGDSLTAMRSLSMVFGIATVAMVFLAGRAITPGIGRLAGLLFAVDPYQIYFAHEARPYALLCFGASLLFYGIVQYVLLIIREPPQPDKQTTTAWLALVLGAAIMVWTNNTAVLQLCPAALVFVLLFACDARSRRFAPALALAALAVLLLWSPYLPELYSQARGVSASFWIQRPTWWGMGDEFRYIFGLNAQGFYSHDSGWWMVVVALCGAVLLLKRAWQLALAVFALSLLPVLLNIGFSLVVTSVFISRAFIGATPAFMVAVAAAIMLQRNRVVRSVLLLAMLGAHAITVTYLLQSDGLKEPWHNVVTSLIQQAGPVNADNASDTVIMMISNEMTLSLTYTLSHTPFTASPVRLIPQQGIPANFPAPGLDAKYPSGKCDPSIEGFGFAPVDEAVRNRKQVFLITRRNNTYDPSNSIHTHLLETGWRETSMAIFQPGDLQLHRYIAGTMQ
jgi:mannosyltransferase